MPLSDFFNSSDGLTVTGTLSSGETLDGFFDIDLNELYADGSESSRTAQFLVEDWNDRASVIGTSITISSQTFTIQNATPDGTGLAVLSLVSP